MLWNTTMLNLLNFILTNWICTNNLWVWVGFALFVNFIGSCLQIQTITCDRILVPDGTTDWKYSLVSWISRKRISISRVFEKSNWHINRQRVFERSVFGKRKSNPHSNRLRAPIGYCNHYRRFPTIYGLPVQSPTKTFLIGLIINHYSYTCDRSLMWGVRHILQMYVWCYRFRHYSKRQLDIFLMYIMYTNYQQLCVFFTNHPSAIICIFFMNHPWFSRQCHVWWLHVFRNGSYHEWYHDNMDNITRH